MLLFIKNLRNIDVHPMKAIKTIAILLILLTQPNNNTNPDEACLRYRL